MHNLFIETRGKREETKFDFFSSFPFISPSPQNLQHTVDEIFMDQQQPVFELYHASILGNLTRTLKEQQQNGE